MIKEYDRVVLLKDIVEEGLKAGDVGTVVHIYRDGERGCATTSWIDPDPQ